LGRERRHRGEGEDEQRCPVGRAWTERIHGKIGDRRGWTSGLGVPGRRRGQCAMPPVRPRRGGRGGGDDRRPPCHVARWWNGRGDGGGRRLVATRTRGGPQGRPARQTASGGPIAKGRTTSPVPGTATGTAGATTTVA